MTFYSKFRDAEKRIAGKLPSIGVVIFLYIFILTLSQGSVLLNDGDTGWQIRCGEDILTTHVVPTAYPHSHAMPNWAWTDYEWLSEAIFAIFHKLMGLNGVVLLAVLVIALTFTFLYRLVLERSGNPLFAAFLAVMAAAASTVHWLPRPHVFSFPLTLVFFVILDGYQKDKKDRLFLMTFITLLWVNLHAGFILGLILVFIYAGGNLLLSFVSSDDRREHRIKSRKLGLILALSLMAACINPYGLALLTFPFRMVSNNYIMDSIKEFLSPDFHKMKAFEVLLIYCGAVFVVSRKKPDLFEGAVIVLLTHMSLYSARYIPLFALLISPMAASRFEDAVLQISGGARSFRLAGQIRERFKKAMDMMVSLEMRPAWHLPIIACIAIAFAVALNGGKLMDIKVMDFNHDPKKFPVDAVNFAVENNITGNMFNDYGWGGYIIYKAYPRYKVFIDGNMAGLQAMRDYGKIIGAEAGYDALLEKYKVSWVIYRPDAPITRLLLETGKWRLVYSDKTAAILLKDIPGNRELIEKYKYAKLITTGRAA